METEDELRSRLGSTPPDIPAFQPQVGDVLKRARTRRLRRYTGAGTAALLVLVGVGLPLAMLSSLGRESHRPISSPSPSVRAVFAATIPTPTGAVDVAVGDGAVWVAGFGRVARLDPVTDQVVATVKTPGTEDFSQVAVGLGAVWITADGGVVYRIDPATNQVAATIRVGGVIQGIDAGGGYVWVTRPEGEVGDLVRVDPVTNRVAGRPIKVGPGPGAVLYAFGALWVTNTSPPSVVRVEPSTSKATFMRFTGLVAAGYGSLWAASGDTVIRVDPATGEPIATVRVPRADAVGVGEGRVWVLAGPRSSNPTLFYPIKHTAALWEIDPATNRIAGRPVYFDALQPIAVAVGLGAAWVADYPQVSNGATITRFDLVAQRG
jgi:streptogramin lyase